MKKNRAAIILVSIAVIILVFNVAWDILTTTDVIPADFNISRYLYPVSVSCGVLGAILAGRPKQQ